MNVRDYIEHLKGKPEAVRRQIALGAASSLTLVVALGWLVAVSSSGVLTLESSNDRGFVNASEDLRTQTENLAGAAAAFNRGEETGSITVVEQSASSTLDREDTGDATVIPF